MLDISFSIRTSRLEQVVSEHYGLYIVLKKQAGHVSLNFMPSGTVIYCYDNSTSFLAIFRTHFVPLAHFFLD